jgi:hypothetical protein
VANPALEAFGAREDLRAFGNNGILLFALQLQLGLDDIESVAATSLTDGSNDKKCDLVYVDRDRERIVVAQGYYSASESKAAAPANKASDLNTAVTWLLTGEISSLPENLRSAARDVRDALADNSIRDLDLWYAHNLPESENVRRELGQAVRTAKGLLATYYPDSQVTSVVSAEIGRSTLEQWYRRTEVPIVVTDKYSVPVHGGFEIRSERWSAYCTSVEGAWLRDMWSRHQADLLSPNVRDYLGIVRSERNINYGIKSSAKDDAAQFWIYNNGLTIVVNDYQAPGEWDANGRGELTVSGLGIVNGAQTTGSLGTLSEAEAAQIERLRIMARFVKCSEPEILSDIVKYNNTQNKVEAADFRSKDAVQERLRQEFASIPEADYRGGRRGGVRDAIERSKNLVADSAVAQALVAFQGRPNLAYNDTRKIWEEDGTYAQYFSDRTTARHIVFAYSLMRAIEATKKEISDLAEGKRTQSQQRQMHYFRQRGSIHLLLAAIAESMESILGGPVPDRFALRFRSNVSPRAASDLWRPIVSACLPFCTQLQDAADLNLKNAERVEVAIRNFQDMIEATVDANRPKYEEFASLVVV